MTTPFTLSHKNYLLINLDFEQITCQNLSVKLAIPTRNLVLAIFSRDLNLWAQMAYELGLFCPLNCFKDSFNRSAYPK